MSLNSLALADAAARLEADLHAGGWNRGAGVWTVVEDRGEPLFAKLFGADFLDAPVANLISRIEPPTAEVVGLVASFELLLYRRRTPWLNEDVRAVIVATRAKQTVTVLRSGKNKPKIRFSLTDAPLDVVAAVRTMHAILDLPPGVKPQTIRI